LKRADDKLNPTWRKVTVRQTDNPKPICWLSSVYGTAIRNRPVTFMRTEIGVGKVKF